VGLKPQLRMGSRLVVRNQTSRDSQTPSSGVVTLRGAPPPGPSNRAGGVGSLADASRLPAISCLSLALHLSPREPFLKAGAVFGHLKTSASPFRLEPPSYSAACL